MTTVGDKEDPVERIQRIADEQFDILIDYDAASAIKDEANYAYLLHIMKRLRERQH